MPREYPLGPSKCFEHLCKIVLSNGDIALTSYTTKARSIGFPPCMKKYHWLQLTVCSKPPLTVRVPARKVLQRDQMVL